MIISAPSYIIPGTYLENVRYAELIPGIRSIELLCFLYDEETDRLLRAELPEIQKYRSRFSFTMHMPDVLEPEHAALIELAGGLVEHFIIHPHPDNKDRFLDIVSVWIDKYGPVFLLENLIEREFESILREEPRLRVCMDTGHLLIRGEEPSVFAADFNDRIDEVHLHGVVEGWDHKPFGPGDEWFLRLVPFLSGFKGICNLEVFKERQIMELLSTLGKTSLI